MFALQNNGIMSSIIVGCQSSLEETRHQPTSNWSLCKVPCWKIYLRCPLQRGFRGSIKGSSNEYVLFYRGF